MTEFEEGEFRAPLFNLLEKGSNLLWEPGQVFEKIIGIDRALFCIHDYLWSLYGFHSPLGGVSLRNSFDIFGIEKRIEKYYLISI